MNIQYISDNKGNKTAVVIPITDWQSLKKKYKDLEKENITEDVPQWHKDVLEQRLKDKKEPINAFDMLDDLDA